MGAVRRRGAALAAACACLAVAPAAAAQTKGVEPSPILGDPMADPEEFSGAAATPDEFPAPAVPRHPFMAPNGLSNLHNDAYQSDTYLWPGPLGEEIETDSALFFRECASITFDSEGRLVTICVGLDRPVLAMLDPVTLTPLATFPLPPRTVSGGNPFTDFSGGGYFYLDHRDRAVAPTTDRHVYVIAETGEPGFELRHDHDLSTTLASDDKIISALPDWRGRIWFASVKGVVGWIGRRAHKIHSRDLGEPIGNSFMVDERGFVYMVTDAALYRLEARGRQVSTVWRAEYENVGAVKPGQTQAGSGTTPTLAGGGRYVAITDNADPMNVVAYQAAADPDGGRRVCREPVFDPGASATDQSLIGAGRALAVENNYGYTVSEVEGGGDGIAPGLTRVDIDRDGRGCRTVWESDERAPSVVPKLSLGAGLLYTYTYPPQNEDDAWYVTALDFDTGETVYRRLAGTGLGFNNNYAPVTLAPDGTAYVGALGGLVRFADASGGR